MKVGVMIGFRRHAKRLFHLPHRIVVKPRRIIHKIVREIADQTQQGKKKPDPPMSLSSLPRRKKSVIKLQYTRRKTARQSRCVLQKKPRRKHYSEASRRPEHKPSQILRIAVVHRALPVPQHDETGITESNGNQRQELTSRGALYFHIPF